MTGDEERRLKRLVKAPITEVDLLREPVREALEDVATIRAICAGEKSRYTARTRIFNRLQRAP